MAKSKGLTQEQMTELARQSEEIAEQAAKMGDPIGQELENVTEAAQSLIIGARELSSAAAKLLNYHEHQRRLAETAAEIAELRAKANA